MIKFKKKISISIIIMILVLLFGGAVNAKTNEKISTGQSGDETYVTLDDLYNKYYLLCSYHGGKLSHLPSKNDVTLVTEVGSSEEGYLKPSDIGKQLFHVSNRMSTPFIQGIYTHDTYAYFKKMSEEIATPKEAYILSELDQNTIDKAGSDHYTEIQHAWWTTPAGSKGQTTVEPNALAKTASAFEEYINKVAEKDSNGKIVYVKQQYDIISEDGTEIISGEIEAPKLKFKASINEDANQDGVINEYDKATVSFDATTGKYKVGPFSINYVEDSYIDENGKEIKFSGLENFTIHSNLGEIPKDKWRFYWLKGERDREATSELPASNEVFYIEIDYIEGLLELTDIKVKAKCMNAGGKYEDLNGTYYKATWTAKSKMGWSSNGLTKTISSRTYWVELTRMRKFTGQRLAAGLIGVRWYDELELSLSAPNIKHTGKLEIKKAIEGGEAASNAFFDFDVYIDGKFYDRVAIRGNDSYVMTIEWETNAPSYEVREVMETMPQGYSYVGITNATGTLKENEVVEIICTNKNDMPHIGKLQIRKNVLGGETDPNVFFDFEIYLNGQFYDRISVRGNETYIETINWDGNQTINYEVREVNIPNGYKFIGMANATGTLNDNSTVEIACNNQKDTPEQHRGKIRIKKEVAGANVDNNKFFDFNIYIDGQFYDRISVKANEAYEDIITWEGNRTPVYEVREVNIPQGYKFVGMTNATGNLNENNTIEVICRNEIDTPKQHYGRLVIKKEILEGSVDGNVFFDFDVYLDGRFYDRVSIKGNETYVDIIGWEGDKAPTYEIREVNIPQEYTYVDMSNATGILSENANISIVCRNKKNTTPTPSPSPTPTPNIEPQKGSLVISKKTIGKPLDSAGNEKEMPEFTFEITIKEDGKQSTTKTVKVKAGETYKSEEYTWTTVPPTYVIKEVNIPDGCISSLHNATGSLIGNKEVWVNCTNTFSNKLVEFTMPMGGRVWEDIIPIEKKDYAFANGSFDEDEKGMEKVEVYIWLVVDGKRELAVIRDYDNQNIIPQPLYTDSEGNWKAPRMTVPYKDGVQFGYYDIEFKYDGQTYEPTTALVTAGGNAKERINGNAETYMNASTSDRNKYENDSMAIEKDEEREAFNNKFAEIFGKNAIDENGNTVGAATGVDSLEYTSKDFTVSGSNNTRKISNLVTRDSNGYVLDKYKMSARTETLGLVYPFDEKLHMKEYDKTINGLTETTKYIATDYYMENINLGLVKRPEADVSITKDLYSARVTVNNKLVTYNYNTLVDLEEEPWSEALTQQVKAADKNITYDLKLYKSDYFYRAAIYDSNTMGYSNDILSQIKAIKTPETEMEVYLTYKVSVRNESLSLYTTINEIADYYDSNLTLVTADIVTPIDVIENNKVNRKDIKVAEKTYYDVLDTAIDPTPYSSVGATGWADWNDSGEINGSDGKKYKRITTNSIKEHKLASGEKIDLYVTFKVNKTATTEGIANSIELGGKTNIAEITNYSTYDVNGKIVGRVDKDSAPGNVNIQNHNDKAWYEDDTDSAPVINLELYDEVRKLNGMVWEDAETKEIQYSQKIGDGEYQEGEKKIAGMTVKLVEKVKANDIDYDYIWPETFDYNGTDLMKVMELNSKVLTNENGEYSMTGIPAGNYIVRFTYGSLADKSKISDDLIAIEGDKTLENGYNGQDYKSTIYQAGFNSINADQSGHLTNTWHDLTNADLKNKRVSDARDDEVRRMEVIAYSRTITGANGAVLASADNKDANHDKLAKYTAMVASTAKLDIEIEYKQLAEENGVDVEVLADGTLLVNGVKISGTNYKYDIPNIDFGLEKRSSTELVLDNQIKRISLKTSSNQTLLDVLYNHEYNIDKDGNIKVTTTVDKENSIGMQHVQSVNNMGDVQGFRYINIDQNIMQGTTVKVEYDMTVLNVGEVDRIGELSKFNTGEEIFKEVEKIKDTYRNSEAVDYGKYVGTVYYTGEGSDEVVGTTIDQIIDYVDNNFVFDTVSNSNVIDGSWRTAAIEELLIGDMQKDILTKNNNNYGIDNSGSMLAARDYYIVEGSNNISNVTEEKLEEFRTQAKNGQTIKNLAILDNQGAMYITEQTNNIALSVSDDSLNPSLLAPTIPYNAYNGGVNKINDKSANYKGHITLTATRFISPETDSKDLQFNNLSEIIQFSSAAGRRDIESTIGNANPAYGEFKAANGGNVDTITGDTIQVLKERDASATEVITLSPPTGINTVEHTKIQFIVIGIIAGIVMIAGVIIIKKKVLNK